MESYSVISIVCPQCGATLEPAEDVCHQCGANTSSSSTDSNASPSDIKQSRMLNNPVLLVIVLLHVGVLGIPLYWGTKYSSSTRLLIIVASIVYTVVAVAGIAWGCSKIYEAIQTLAR